MSTLRRFYATLGAFIAAGVAAFILLPHGELLRDLAAVPIVASCVAIIIQLARDQAAHDRTRTLMDYQNQFALAASSHMAEVAFDKHVQFCEEYVKEVQDTLVTLFHHSATEKLFDHTRELSRIQSKYAVWLTPKIEDELEQFETALRKMGTTASLLRSNGQEHVPPERVTDLYKTLADVMGRQFFPNGWEGQPMNDEIAIARVIQRLRSILGTEQLTSIRTRLTEYSAKLGATDG
jgi:hypothetical protein